MTHEELLKLAGGEAATTVTLVPREKLTAALQAVVELHKPYESSNACQGCDDRCGCSEGDILRVNTWDTCPTITAIWKELK